jgi:hypothetical protein
VSWNYRVIRHEVGSETAWDGIHEVYYDELGRANSWTKKPVRVIADAEDKGGFAAQLWGMSEAIRKPWFKIEGEGLVAVQHES